MIKKLQIKFIIIIMSIMSVVLFLIFGAINFSMHKISEYQNISMMVRIAKNDGKRPLFPQIPNPGMLPSQDTFVSNDHFSVILDKRDNIQSVIFLRQTEYSQNEILDLVEYVLKLGKNIGTINNTRFLLRDKPYGKIIVFMDITLENTISSRLMWASALIGVSGLMIIFIMSLFLSNWAIKPVKTAFQSQKQFISDASHELKTPLTVINANIDALYVDRENNKWIDYIRAETERMNGLVNNLLYLAKLGNAENAYHFAEFNLSDAITSAVLPFESVVFESGKVLHLDIEQNIYTYGDENRIKQVIIILLDNAVKNSDKNGNIKVSFKTQGCKKIIYVFNTGTEIPRGEQDRIFERFYRTDSSRTRQTGCYGLGLSIAKTIIDRHKGKIFTENVKGEGVKFIVEL